MGYATMLEAKDRREKERRAEAGDTGVMVSERRRERARGRGCHGRVRGQAENPERVQGEGVSGLFESLGGAPQPNELPRT